MREIFFKKMTQNRHISHKIIFYIEFFGGEEKKLWDRSRKNKWINNDTKSTHSKIFLLPLLEIRIDKS